MKRFAFASLKEVLVRLIVFVAVAALGSAYFASAVTVTDFSVFLSNEGAWKVMVSFLLVGVIVGGIAFGLGRMVSDLLFGGPTLSIKQ